jgi:hypothetical protein
MGDPRRVELPRTDERGVGPLKGVPGEWRLSAKPS